MTKKQPTTAAAQLTAIIELANALSHLLPKMPPSRRLPTEKRIAAAWAALQPPPATKKALVRQVEYLLRYHGSWLDQKLLVDGSAAPNSRRIRLRVITHFVKALRELRGKEAGTASQKPTLLRRGLVAQCVEGWRPSNKPKRGPPPKARRGKSRDELTNDLLVALGILPPPKRGRVRDPSDTGAEADKARDLDAARKRANRRRL